MKKTAIVTGANGGIGKILVKKFEEEGIRCVCIDKEGTMDDNFLPCDFTKQEEVENLVNTVTGKFESIDMLINLAGIGIYKNIEDLSLNEWNDSMTINLTSPFILMKGLLPLLKKSGNGIVINFGSGMGVEPTPGRIAYCSSKFALRGLSLTLSKEFKGNNVKMVHLTLGSIMTNFGTGGLELRKKLEKEGKNYLDPNEVVEKVVGIINSSDPEPEYVIYPKGYTSTS